MVSLSGECFQAAKQYFTGSKSQLLIVVKSIALIASLVSCSGSGLDPAQNTASDDSEKISVNLTTPSPLIAPLIIDLQAQLSLDARVPEDLYVDNSANTISGLIEDVSPENHEVFISYFVIIDDVEITLATITKIVIVMPGETLELKVTDTDLVFNYDADGDGITNLAEVKLGSDPNSSSDVPVFAMQFSPGVASYVLATTASGFEVVSGAGGSIAGKTESVNYQVVTGFIAH